MDDEQRFAEAIRASLQPAVIPITTGEVVEAAEFLELPESYEPADWQVNDLDYLQQQNYSANWSEMGCYKTTTGLWLIERKLKQITPSKINPVFVVITTKSGKGTYFDAIPKSLTGFRVFDVGSTSIEELDSGFRFKVIPQEFLEKCNKGTAPVIVLSHYHAFANRSKMFIQALSQIMYAGIVIDEAHRIKEKDNQWTRNIKTLQTWTGFKHLMTGTGFINRPHEIWSLLNFLDKEKWSSITKFRSEFSDEMVLDSGFTVIYGVKPEKKEEFRNIRKALGPRRRLSEVRPDIRIPIFTPLAVELNATQRKMYDEIKMALQTMDREGIQLTSPNVLSQLSRLRQICVATPRVVADYYDPDKDRRVQEIELEEPSSKLDALMELISNMSWDDESKQQLVIFSNFVGPLDLLQKRLEKADIPYLWMKEKHDDTERYEMWHDTWPKKEHRVFMSTIMLGGESINLSSAQHVVFLDRSWSPKDNNQAVSRVYRPGQEGQTQVIHINALKTTDQRIESVNRVKEGWFNEIFGPTDAAPVVVPEMDEPAHDVGITLTELELDFDKLLNEHDTNTSMGFGDILDEDDDGA